MPTTILFALVAVLVFGTLLGEALGRRWLEVACKPAASACFLFLAWRTAEAGDPYGAWVMVALALSAAGDVLLAFPAAFRAGLVAFLLAHVAYVAAFHTLWPASSWPFALATPVAVASALAARWLLPHAGRLRAAVAAYIAVITVMVWGGVSVGVGPPARALAAIGAVLFYLSDLAVARNRFVHKALANRLWGLPAYYLAQCLLALSTAP
ncbi:MAG: lysoplasmalogenase [Acidobacteriota bacterium]